MTRPLAVALLFLLAPLTRGDDKLTLTVKETAGLRRFGYPAYVKLELPRLATDKDRFRLLANGKPLGAQFRLLEDRKTVALDFTASPGPFEQATFVVEYGPAVEEVKEKGGLRLDETKEKYTVTSGGMKYVVPVSLKGLLEEVKDGKKTFTRDGSPGLGLRLGKDTVHAIGPATANLKHRVTRKGPHAVGLRFEGEEKLTGGRVPWVVEMTFPRSKSWVEVNWTLKPDDKAKLEGLLVDLNLLTAGAPTLADFGAGSMVYAKLDKGQSALLTARPGHQREAKSPLWEVLTGKGGDLRSFARAAPERGSPAEGWAHLMDKQRCTAVAVDGFGKTHADEIRLDADGRLLLRRSRAVLPLTMKSLRFWLHFVDVPVQVGALTSPQSMMAPLVVEVK